MGFLYGLVSHGEETGLVEFPVDDVADRIRFKMTEGQRYLLSYPLSKTQ